MRELKRYTTELERRIMKVFRELGYIVFRSPLSMLPFDLLVVDPKNFVIKFVEIKKSEKSKLTERQQKFKQLFEEEKLWRVKYEVIYYDSFRKE